MGEILSFSEAAERIPEIADRFQAERLKSDGLVSVHLHEEGKTCLEIVEADVWAALVRIHQELDRLVCEDKGPDAFGLLQDTFEKDPLPKERLKRIGNAYLAFRARLGSIPMSWVPGSTNDRTKDSINKNTTH
jgi:hypothetical protein